MFPSLVDKSCSQCLYEAVNVTEGVVERHWCDSHHIGLPYVTLGERKYQVK